MIFCNTGQQSPKAGGSSPLQSVRGLKIRNTNSFLIDMNLSLDKILMYVLPRCSVHSSSSGTNVSLTLQRLSPSIAP